MHLCEQVKSDRLYVSNWKMLTEAIRKSTYVSGYECTRMTIVAGIWVAFFPRVPAAIVRTGWLLQEYYCVGDGILDTHFQPKVGATELREIASMNAPVVLLLAQPEDDLPIPDAAPRFQT